MSKHTPGPWEIDEQDYGDELWFGGTGCGLVTVNGWSNGGCKDQPDEWAQLLTDARLIAAAPELLDALHGLLNVIRETRGLRSYNAVLVAQKAIAKAEGV